MKNKKIIFKKKKLCYMNTDNFIVYIKTNKHIAEDVETIIIHKIFETNSSFHVKQRSMGKVKHVHMKQAKIQ